jgi:tRNA-specific 2-thiouridylase
VVEKKMDTNKLIVTQGKDHPSLSHSHCRISGLHWINSVDTSKSVIFQAKTRYRQSDQHCKILNIDNDTAIVEFENQQRAVTPGQALVIYQEEVCLGGATIEAAFNQTD